MAKKLALESKCVSYKVACLFVKDGRIIATGINGTPPGYLNCCDRFPGGKTPEHHEWSDTHEIHAEQNAITYAARKGIALEGSTVYCTLKPCKHCTKLLITLGVHNIFYIDRYRRNDDDTLDLFLLRCTINITQLEV